MTQFNITDWCDFVRGLVRADEKQRMERHLVTSESDRRTVEILSRVAAVAREDRALEIPEHAVRGAKAIGSLARPEVETASPRPSLLRRLSFDVVFDSLHQAAAGTRDLHTAHRQILLEADRFTVDVRWEQESDPQHSVIVGQIVRRPENAVPVTDVPVYVVAEGQIVGRARSNRFGEFQLEKLPRKTLKLCLVVDAEECLELSISDGANNGEQRV